jgi:hypothetical protein
MQSTFATRCAARALARNIRCRGRLAVGAGGQGHCRSTSRSQEQAARPAVASARLKHVERKNESRGLRSTVSAERSAIASKRRSIEAARWPCAFTQRPIARPVQAPARRTAPPALVCFVNQTQCKAGLTRAWPNPSIEGTAKRLRLLSAPHVKR